jgi:hypothetical protein
LKRTSEVTDEERHMFDVFEGIDVPPDEAAADAAAAESVFKGLEMVIIYIIKIQRNKDNSCKLYIV